MAATSISRLSEATGLSVGSLYKAFDSKGDLCARTLDRYLDDGLDTLDSLLDSGDSAVAGIDAWLDALADMAAGSEGPRGCYGVVCAVELAGDEPDVRNRLRRHDRLLLRRLTVALRRARSEGAEVTTPLDDAARFLYTAVNGVQVEARKGIDLDDARRTLAIARRAVVR